MDIKEQFKDTLHRKVMCQKKMDMLTAKVNKYQSELKRQVNIHNELSHQLQLIKDKRIAIARSKK